MKKRIISFVLVLALLVQIFPTYVFAENEAGNTPSAESTESIAMEPDGGITTPLVLGELPERRGESEKHFRLDDGSFIAVDYGAPVHYSTDDGETWEDIDNTLVLSGTETSTAQIQGIGNRGSSYVAENGDTSRSFAADLRSGFLFSTRDGQHGVSMSLTTSTENFAAATVDVENADVKDSSPSNVKAEAPVIPAFNSSAVAEISYPDVKPANSATDPNGGKASSSPDGSGSMAGHTTGKDSSELPEQDAQGNEKTDESPSLAEQVTPQKLRADVLYRNVFDGVDLSYELYSYNVKETILINRPLDNYVFSFDLDLDGLTPVLMEDGSIELRDEAEAPIYLIPAPYMYDEAGAESDAVSYSLTQRNGTWTLVIAADTDWIDDEDRVFPVAIDPTIYFAGDSTNQQIYSGYVNDNSPNTHPSDSKYYIRSGNYQNSGATAGHAIGLIYVNKLPSIPENCVVTTSMLKLFQTNYSNGNSGYYNYPRLYTSQITDSSFSEGNALSFINSLTWNNLTNKVTYGGGSSLETRTTIDYTKCKINTLGDHYFEITDTTRQWYEGTDTISRLLVLDDGERNMSINSRATFTGYVGNSNFGHQPQLVVLYRNTIGVEGYYDYLSQNIGRAGTAHVNNFTLGLSLSVPVFSAPSQALPFGLALTYNSPISTSEFTASSTLHTKNYTNSGTGYGWKSSVQQSVAVINLTGNEGEQKKWLVYTDADGTEHYFNRNADNNLKYEDEDGLGLTITINNASSPTEFTMKDKEKNTWTFLYGYLSSYIDNNGNALYYAYNGYDYNSSNTSWKPTNANTVYRVTSVWRKNNGVSSATKLVTLNYTNDRLSSITDMANRSTTFAYDENGNLVTITYPDGKTASYTYVQKTNTDPQTGSSRTFHRLTRARDDESLYEIRYTYRSSTINRIYKITEYAGAVGNQQSGSSIWCSKAGALYTRIRYLGADLSVSTDDDIVVRYYFDNWGRPINVATMYADETAILGISAGTFKQNNGTDKDNNRLFHAASSGLQNVNLLYNSGLEYSDNPLFGWNSAGDGTVTSVASLTASSGSAIKPKTGNKMLQMKRTSSAAGKESCSQNVYLTAGTTYVFSAYVNTAAVPSSSSGSVYLSFRNSSSQDLSNTSSKLLNYQTNITVDNGWERLETAYTPASSGTYQVAVNTTFPTASVVADNLQLEIFPQLDNILDETSASTMNLLQLGGFELPSASGMDTSKVETFWTFSTGTENNQTVKRIILETNEERSSKVIRLDNAPDRQVSATQTVTLNAPSNLSYLISAWGKMPVGYTSSGNNMKYNNATYERFFGIIAEIKYAGYSELEYQYIAFNDDTSVWQHVSGIITPKRDNRIVESITVKIRGDFLPNDAYVDDVTMVQEPAQTYTYDPNGNLTATTNTEGKTSTELDSQERLKKYTAMTDVEYDLHYANNTTRNPQYMTSGDVKTSYEYESSGSVKKTTVQATAGGKKLESTTNYDSTLNFVASSTDVNGSTVTNSYNTSKGTLSNSTDPRGTTTYHTYIEENDRIRLTYSTGLDALYYDYTQKGQLEELSRKSFDPAVFWQGYHFDYDEWGNTTEIQVWSSPSSSATPPTDYDSTTLANYEYNSNGTLKKMMYPNGDYVLYAYDVLDRLIEEVYYNHDDVEVVRYRYVYNANGQLARQYVQKNGVETESYSFEYDSLGRLIRSREEKGTNQVQRTEHLYDTANRLTKQNWSIGATGFSESYTYDGNDGTMSAFSTSFTLPNGSTDTYKLDYSYDPLKRLEQASYRYDNNSTLLYTRNYTYLNRSGSSDLTTSRLGTYVVCNANSSVISGNRYEYDANGNITKIEEVYTLNDADAYRTTAEYTYDALNQLKRETRYTYSGSSAVPATTTTVNYTIDTAGNLRSVSGGEHSVAYTYGDNAWADLLTGITVDNVTRTINYASAGNPSNWYNGTDYTNLTWTQGRRLSSLTKGSQTYSYEYDMSGIRSVKIANGLRHEYVTQNGKVVREIVTNASTGAFQYALDFTYDEAGHPLTMRKYNNADMQTNYITMQYVCNAQGDVVKLIYNGTVYAEYTYDAWGNAIIKTGSLNYENVNPLRYRGYYFDTESGFYYLQSRYYDPIVKRFLNADSRGSTGQGFLGLNMFAYCGDNPITRSDPSGHSWLSWITKVREMVEKVKKEIAERNKKEFKQTFEKARGKTVDECFVGVEWMCVKKETICPDKIPSWIGPAVTILGGVVNTIAKFTPAAAISIACDICTYAGVGITVIDVLSNDDPYDQFVVDVGGTCDWHRDPNTGEWTGRAIGEIYYFNIIKEQGESVGLEFAGASRYTTTAAEKGFYMYDFDFGFSTLINPF